MPRPCSPGLTTRARAGRKLPLFSTAASPTSCASRSGRPDGAAARTAGLASAASSAAYVTRRTRVLVIDNHSQHAMAQAMLFARHSLLRLLRTLLPALGLAIAAVPASAATPAAEVQTSWRMLDYIAVDYGGAVANGRIVSQGEFQEMTEFSASVSKKLAALPGKPARAALIRKSAELEKAIAARASPDTVAAIARNLGGDLSAAYPVPLAPTSPPDPARAANLFPENCAACQGRN